ncbi:hypothetical protein SKAU_G00177800 [Synaphobranchus kaupii]|uniref:Glucoside xylosyltransferase 2 n=1 Tax=Synaphobranchus kaupii TaxID=118154 RepID=A0A9Q1FLP8_SYNKA|nr:hypothetical protein SKAU_G00177800 [Synaphobranchus kaupii]
MKIHCKIVVIVVCFGVLLLLYFLVGNAADEPPLKEVANDNYFPPSSGLGKIVSVKLGKKPRVSRISQNQPRPNRREGKVTNRGGFVNAKLRPRNEAGRPASRGALSEEWMHLAVVACGNRLDETLTLIKSALLFSVKKIKFHIFAEDALASLFQKGLSKWPRLVSSRFQYSVYPITFSVGNAEEWKKLFKPCAAQRLFLPVILRDVDSLLYVDTDVLFLRPMDDIWSFLKEFNSTQLAAMAPEHEIPKIGCTLFKNNMISTGLSWEDLLHPLYQKYRNHITWGDQDLLNIIFHFNPGTVIVHGWAPKSAVYTFPCQWNYRPDHCMYGSNCKGAEEEGVAILHGNRGVYHDDKQPAFKAVYDAIHDYPFDDNIYQSLFYPLQTKFLDTVNTLCGRIPQVFLKQVEKTMKTLYEQNVIVRVKRPHQ